METTKELEVQKFTEKEVFDAINNLDDKYIEVLGELKLSEIAHMVNENLADEYVNCYEAAIEKHKLTVSAIRLLGDELMHPKYESLELVKKFDKMKDIDKGQFLYEILKNDQNACEVLKASYTRVAEEAEKSPELNIVFEKMGLKKFLLNLISWCK
ncbi:hypothetical protein [Anaerotignum sp.]|uniref:hypothetical protein n=1 Tax=Anaerotignum sp. TaxID=2039241 RepID=UPI002899B731|nr:hypothetical protein [Anaerotignum sp.]